jgi:hypothetical protein
VLAAGLREVEAGSDAEANGRRLEQHRHEVGDEDDRQQRVAELRSAGERGRPVAWIHVADGDEIAGAEEGEHPAPGGGAGVVGFGSRSGRGDRAVHLRQAGPRIGELAEACPFRADRRH